MVVGPTAEGRTGHQEFAGRVAGARVFDLGCADGAVLEVLASQGVEGVAGIGLSDEELAIACRRSAPARADPRRVILRSGDGRARIRAVLDGGRSPSSVKITFATAGLA